MYKGTLIGASDKEADRQILSVNLDEVRKWAKGKLPPGSTMSVLVTRQVDEKVETILPPEREDVQH